MSRLVKTITISGKSVDSCYTGLYDASEKEIAVSDGYAPEIDNLCDGDYVELEVDVETGKIVGWVAPTDAEFAKLYSEYGTINDSRLQDLVED